MRLEAIHALEVVPRHARWLHDLRNVVSTASVAATMSRRLLHEDPEAALELLREAERALVGCRDLLAQGGEHVRDEALVDAAPVSPVAEWRRERDVAGTVR